jgi:hypothetical protein
VVLSGVWKGNFDFFMLVYGGRVVCDSNLVSIYQNHKYLMVINLYISCIYLNCKERAGKDRSQPIRKEQDKDEDQSETGSKDSKQVIG